MQASLIFFQKGSGGNFLNRVLTLDESTVPLGGYPESLKLSTQERFQRYHYDGIVDVIGKNFNQFDPDKQSLSRWVWVELKEMFFPLTIGMEKLVQYNQHVVEFVHPSDRHKISLFGSDDAISCYFLDSTGCHEWVLKQMQHKINPILTMRDVIQEYQLLMALSDNWNLPSFDLRRLLDENTFASECQRMCDTVGVKFFKDESTMIYQSWRRTWA